MHEMDIRIAQEWVEVALTYIFFFAQPNTSTRVCDLVARASMPRWYVKPADLWRSWQGVAGACKGGLVPCSPAACH